MAPLRCAKCEKVFRTKALLEKHICTSTAAEAEKEEVKDELQISNEQQTTDSEESDDNAGAPPLKKLRIENHQRQPKGGDKRENAPKADVTAHDEQTYATNRVTAIEREISSIKAEVLNMKSVLHAMEAAQVRHACPPGFDSDKFAVLTKRSAKQLDKDIRAKEDDIRRKEVQEVKLQDDIRSLWQQEAGQRPSPPQTHTAASPQPNFTTVQEAVNVLLQCPKASKPEVTDELSMCVKRYNETTITNGLTSGVQKLMAAVVGSSDKAYVPLMCVLGVSGQGKTDTLNFIRRDANVHALVIQEINKHIGLMKPRRTCKHVVPLFATFNQGYGFNRSLEPNIERALCNRLLSNYLGVVFDVSQSTRFAYFGLQHLTEFVRQREADKRRCTPAEVCVIVLVDEVLKLVKGTDRETMTNLLDLITTTQNFALIDSATKDFTFAVVTSLEVKSVHACVTLASGRPLHSIPLYPCSVADIDDVVDRMVKFEVRSGNLKVMYANDARAALRWPAHGTGGHFRSLHNVWLRFRRDPRGFKWQPDREFLTAAHILDVIAQRLNDPLLTMKETDPIGAAFSKRGVSMTLYAAAESNVEGVFYKGTNEVSNLVSPCAMPSGLSERWPFKDDTEVAQKIVKLWNEIHTGLTSVKVEKGWEMSLPQLEVIASTLIYEVNGKKRVAFDEVWRGAVVKDWTNRNTKLCYRPVGSGCGGVYSPGATKLSQDTDEVQEHKDDDKALRNACRSKVPRLVRAESSNYPGIEGVHTMLEEELPSAGRRVARRLIPVVIQMKALKTVTKGLLVEWAEAAHARAKHLGLKDRSYFVVLYVSHTPKGDGWRTAIPEGTIVLNREALVQFLSPFGMTPLLRMLDTRAKS